MDLIDRASAIEALGEPHPLDYNRISAVEKVRGLPSVDAVPLDKLCEWLTSIPMMNCRVCKESIGFCTSEEAADHCCGSKERWKAILTMLMEGLDAEKED